MQVSLDIAFKEWAVVVDALGRGEQTLILRKGGIREERGEFHADHSQFWLFPTQFHEVERSIIPSKRPALQDVASRMVKDAVDIEFLAVVDTVLHITDINVLGRLQGRHIWGAQVLRQRFEFGRVPGLHALITRVYRLESPQRFLMRDSYGGCKSWVQLGQPIAAEVTPVLTDAQFAAQRDELCQLIGEHALAHS